MSDKLSGKSDVSSAFYESEEFRDPAKLIRLISADPALNIKARLWKAAMRLGLGYQRARAIWYGEARVDFAEMDRLREIAEPEWEAEQERKAREHIRASKDHAARIRAKSWEHLSKDADPDS